MKYNLMVRGAGVAVLAFLTACGAGRRTAGEAPDRSVLEQSEIENTLHPNVYALIQALRPHWLEVRGGGSLASRSMAKRVYLDDMYLGGPALLRQLSTVSVEQIQYFDGPAATQLWGQDHSGGVIQVRSRNH